MKLILRSFIFCFFALSSLQVFAQPANDDCANATPVTIGADEENAIKVAGDTRGGTPSAEPASVCSGSWFSDDVWYSFTTGDMIPEKGLTIKAFFNRALDLENVPAVGMALYNSCDVDAEPLQCFSSADAEMNSIELAPVCGAPNTTYFVRIWSGVSPTDDSGTFEVAVFNRTSRDNILYNETFGNGLEGSGWATSGECQVNPDSSANARWTYRPNGLVDMGAFIFQGAGINSLTLCDGAVGVDSDFNDTGGPDGGGAGTGQCPSSAALPGIYILTSPSIYTGDFDVAGISVSFTQYIRQFQSVYFVSFRTKNTGDTEWSDFTNFQINQDLEVNGNAATLPFRQFMPGATEGDSVQFQLQYNAHYYFWAIDDFQLFETEANNLRVQSNFFSVAPWQNIPESQVFPFPVLSDVRNAGARTQTNVELNYTVEASDNTVIYNENFDYNDIGPDSTAENQLFPDLVTVPNDVSDSYTATFAITSDSMDFDESDNMIQSTFMTGGNVYRYENGQTRDVFVNTALYADGAPFSYVYGNAFYFPSGAGFELDSFQWGVGDVSGLVDKSVNLFLLKWTDSNGNQIAEFDEREFSGFATHIFDGTESNTIISSKLDNFNSPGDPITLENNATYLAVVEYQAEDQTEFPMLASEDFDYGAAIFAADSAFLKNIQTHRTNIAVLGFADDGNVSGIDYEVREFGDDGRAFFGNDIVAVVRLMLVIDGVSTDDQLPEDNLVSIFPNPASDFTTLDMEFSKVYDKVVVNITNIEGKQISQRVLEGVQKQKEIFDVSNLPAGNYMFQVITDDGFRTQPFVVQR